MDLDAAPRRSIGTFNETALHAQLKAWYASEPGDRTEVPLEGRQIDVVRGELLIEVQTGSFGSIRAKLEDLLDRHPVRLVHPVPAERWVVRQGPDGQLLGRRRSPRRGRVEDAFAELVRLPRLFLRPNFSFEVLLVRDEELRARTGRAWRNRGWVVQERRLLAVLDRRRLTSANLLDLLPPGLPDLFTTADLARGLGVDRTVAQQMAYCLREARAIEARERGRSGWLYARSGTAPSDPCPSATAIPSEVRPLLEARA